MEYMKRIRDKFNPKMKFYYMGFYVNGCQKSMYKEHMHPQNLLCPFTYTYVPLTKEIKKEITAKKFLKLNPEAEEVKNNNIEKLVEFLMDFKLIFERDKWLRMDGIKEDMRIKFTETLNSMHKIMGDTFLDTFVFEYQ
mmetsp:Transcript_27036/g.23866  ORF Transcript_27036/g.23866 Transcript_27036/m.23866 type:complete len:138 (+) Transcript_27036:1408-1821(+)